jgi:hypothetical protein
MKEAGGVNACANLYAQRALVNPGGCLQAHIKNICQKSAVASARKADPPGRPEPNRPIDAQFAPAD